MLVLKKLFVVLEDKIIKIYTDGSCNTESKVGGWALIILNNLENIVLQNLELETTHNRMELTAVIKAIEYIKNKIPNYNLIQIYTDSQYVAQIPKRADKIISKDFKTNKGKDIQNLDLIKRLMQLIESTKIEFIKVKAHQKSTNQPNYNREVDKLSRKIVRNYMNS